jgi:hypothetical protein
MSDLNSSLIDLAGAAARSATLPAADAVRHRGAQRTRRRVVGLAFAAVLGVSVAAGALTVTARNEGLPAPAATTVTAAPTDAASPSASPAPTSAPPAPTTGAPTSPAAGGFVSFPTDAVYLRASELPLVGTYAWQVQNIPPGKLRYLHDFPPLLESLTQCGGEGVRWEDRSLIVIDRKRHSSATPKMPMVTQAILIYADDAAAQAGLADLKAAAAETCEGMLGRRLGARGSAHVASIAETADGFAFTTRLVKPDGSPAVVPMTQTVTREYFVRRGQVISIVMIHAQTEEKAVVDAVTATTVDDEAVLAKMADRLCNYPDVC